MIGRNPMVWEEIKDRIPSHLLRQYEIHCRFNGSRSLPQKLHREMSKALARSK